MKGKTGKSLSVVLRRSVPKLFLILTASIPALVIPSLVVGKSKDRNLKQVEGECVGSRIHETLSKSGRFVVGQRENHSYFTHLIGNHIAEAPPPPQPVYEVPPNEEILLPPEKTYEDLYQEQKTWEQQVEPPAEPPTRLEEIPTPPPPPPPSEPEPQPEPVCQVEKIEKDPKVAYFENLFPGQAFEIAEPLPTLPEVEVCLELEPTLEIVSEIAEVPVETPAPKPEPTPAPTPKPTTAAPEPEPRTILKLFPLRPETFGKTEQTELEKKPAEAPPQPKPETKTPEPKPETPVIKVPEPKPETKTPEPKPETKAPEPKPSAPAEELPIAPSTEEKPAPVEEKKPEPAPTPTPPPAPAPAIHAAKSVQATVPQVQELQTQAPAPAPTAIPTTSVNPSQAGYLTNYTNLNIKEFIRFISRITNKNFVFNEDDLNFNISMISEKRSTPEELISMLMQQLRIHGLAVIEEGDSFIIHTNPEVNSPATVLPRSPGEEVPNDVQIITQVFRLNVIQPSQAISIIKPLLSAQAVMEPLDESGLLTLTDLRVNIEKVKDLLIQLDQPSSGLDVSHFKSEYINSDTLTQLGEKILTPLAEGKEIRFIPLKNSNMIFIISTPIMVKRAIEFFTSLDKEIKYNAGDVPGALLGGQEVTKPTEEEKQKLIESFQGPLNELNETLTSATPATSSANTEFDTYKLEYRKGDQIQAALQQIADSLIKTIQTNPDGTTNDLYDAIGTVQWIEASNTLVFTGTPRANAKIEDLIRDLDTPNQQVLIEMLLLDTSIDRSYHFGVDWGSRFGSPTAGGAQAFLTPSSPLSGSLDAVLPAEFINPTQIARSAGFSLGVIGKLISCDGMTFSTIGALVTAIDELDIGKVILNPKIVVEENNTAEIFVGLNVPFKTQSIANDFGTILTNNFEYRDIGARMTVTPIINKNGIITLEIEQELSTLISSTTSVVTNSFFEVTSIAQGAGPTTRKSNSKTTVFVPNNHFVIMSGMIQDESERIRTQIPCLGGIPVLGGVFSQKDNREQNRNLMIFIRPSLINTEEEMTYYTKREQDIYDQKCREKDNWKYEIEEALDFLNINQDRCCR